MNKEDQPMRIEGYEDCILGTMDRYGFEFPVLCYDLPKIINKMVKNGMSEEEAYEYYHYNLIGAWVGDGTPVFLSPGDKH